MKTLTIGRSSQCDIVINDVSMEHIISRVHAEISYANGQYIYRNLGKNGSTLHGVSIGESPISVSPGDPILLANRILLPWVQVYAMLPSSVEIPNSSITHKEIPVGWSILSLLIPLVGFILYFIWKNSFSKKASQCLIWGSIGLVLNLIGTICLTL